ncbi:hypothetical protein ACQ31_gp139 [Salmonella phage STML-198]|uniref:Uncharacterized protein n=2 Tax=Gelderlandvirus TaxID=1913653 RepID=K4I417_9CAUD|nr:hypothetical protein ACQ31_gp139 [Salmonella phage STML-198]YP_009615557.1 hypothetical protein FDI73_gp071 [Salmonella phage Melville]AFU64022.1 hypothetical protein [Salmonella phage STML-198]ATN93045.1 hypothetical protein CPT_Melville_071 [Salmonella phage Melville]UPW42446.1 hypothetical protein EBPHNEJP_00148 [Salmonella phage CF-SP2]
MKTIELNDDEAVIKQEELFRLYEVEELLWQIECDLPSGLESWVNDEQLNHLRGE